MFTGSGIAKIRNESYNTFQPSLSFVGDNLANSFLKSQSFHKLKFSKRAYDIVAALLLSESAIILLDCPQYLPTLSK